MRVVLVALCCAAVAAGAARAHAPGGWLTKADVQRAAATADMPRLQCTGVGLVNEVTQGSYNGFGQVAAVQYRHFGCVGFDRRRVATWRVCIHVLGGAKLQQTRRRLPAPRCRF